MYVQSTFCVQEVIVSGNSVKVAFEVNSFAVDVPFLYFPKTLEKLWFSGVFRGYKMGILAANGLND